MTHNDDELRFKKYKTILELYVYFWKQFSSTIVSIDQQFKQVNRVVNFVYSQVEHDEDSDEDHHPYSILRQALIVWHTKVYKKCYKSLSKGLRL